MMFGSLLVHIHKTRQTGPQVAIDCPLCGELCVLAHSYRLQETAKLLFVLPLARTNTTVLLCQRCGKSMYSSLPINRLLDTDPDVVQRSIAPRHRLVSNVLIVAAMLCCWLPLIGLMLTVIVWALNRHRHARRWRVFITTLFVVSVLATLVEVIVLAASP